MLEGYRRWIAVLIPVLVMASGALGFPLTEDVLADFSDKVVVAIMAGLALWSKVVPDRA
jgi:hypothetical protein